ncbi:MAG: ATP-binding cassette domain-containing protein [Lachnospiraceae bacterium]|nr:ATP-binding cassette domain-containing protein [Lachnospiraceae bacterium]
MEDKKVLLSIDDLEVKFRVRGRILTAIRGIFLDIYENESIAIVGESGSGKSVFTKTFAGMLDSNGYISEGHVVFHDPELEATTVKLNAAGKRALSVIQAHLDRSSRLEAGAKTYRQMLELESEYKAKAALSDEEDEKLNAEISAIKFQRTELFNTRQTYDPKNEKDLIKKAGEEIEALDRKIKELEGSRTALIKERKEKLQSDTTYMQSYRERKAGLKEQYEKETAQEISKEQKERNALLAKEIYLSTGRYNYRRRIKAVRRLEQAATEAMRLGEDLSTTEGRSRIFTSDMYVELKSETADALHGTCMLDLSKITYPGDWGQIRGTRIATVFQDPMTSLNPIITIGKQITSVILKHQNCSESEARERALILMKQVGIPNAENRFDDYPFQYSGGMRQRIVIAIALSCQPKILICDEPTTALDVTIQAQILNLIKELQKEYGYTIVFITHDLGVVANVADRVAVLYAGQVVELGTVEEVFYDPRHPYTWALLSSLPQLAEKGTELYSITGTPPSLYNKIKGDAFAPRNPYCLKLDTLEEPPMFRVSETHYAKTWFLDPRAPKVEKPSIIGDIHGKLVSAYHLG